MWLCACIKPWKRNKPRNIHVSKGKEIPFCFFSFFFCLGENNSVQFLNKIWSQIFISWELISLQPCCFQNQGTWKPWDCGYTSLLPGMLGLQGWWELQKYPESGPKKTCTMSAAEPKLCSQAALYRADRIPSRFLQVPGVCFWNIASSDALHMQMCRTLCFAGLQISTRFDSAGFLGSTFPQL